MARQEDTLDLSFNNPRFNEGFDNTLVGELLSQKVVNHTAIISIITLAWNMGNNIQMKSFDNNMISCTLKKERKTC